jgi:beta-lactam-binding protein with PASTA domain
VTATPSTTSTGDEPAAPDVARVVVPDVVGLELGEVRETLRSAGFRVVVEGPEGAAPTYVVTQSPAPGTEVEAGTDVRVTAGPWEDVP